MIVLTPGFEEGGKLLIVTAMFIVLCGYLTVGSLQFMNMPPNARDLTPLMGCKT
jgi:hypothetical protein